MKNVPVATLKVGSKADTDYLGADGKILVKKGAIINELVLKALLRRRISTLIVAEESDDLKNLLRLKDLDFDDLGESVHEGSSGFSPPGDLPPPPEIVLPIAAGVPQGKEGLKEILKAPEIQEIDKNIDAQGEDFSVKISGKALVEEAVTVRFGSRTVAHKKQSEDAYAAAVQEVKKIFLKARQGEMGESALFRSVVDDFIKNFLRDRHLLLNLATFTFDDPDYLFSHSVNTSLLAISVGASKGFNREQIQEIGMGALLHDIGALFIPESIRFKSENLEGDELYEVQKHPVLGSYLIEGVKGLPPTVTWICYQSHERENKKGYPKGRGGFRTHPFAKIVAIVDIFESLVAGRPYRPALVPYQAMEKLLFKVKAGELDSKPLKSFMEYTSLFPVGSLVKLNDGVIAKVIQANQSTFSRPVVTTVISANHKVILEGKLRKSTWP